MNTQPNLQLLKYRIIEQVMQANQETVLIHLLSELEKTEASQERNANAPRTLGELMRQSPLVGLDLDFSRDNGVLRPLDLSGE